VPNVNKISQSAAKLLMIQQFLVSLSMGNFLLLISPRWGSNQTKLGDDIGQSSIMVMCGSPSCLIVLKYLLVICYQHDYLIVGAVLLLLLLR